jgi:RimJ/RimL family protein N-acetyltransferase
MGDVEESAGRPILNMEGEHVGLGPLRRDLLPVYQRWINNLETMRTLDLPPYPLTMEKEQDWYDRQSRAESDVPFTIYERETLRPIGNTGLHEVDYRNRTASFGILIGEPECRGKGYGTETTRLMLDYAFTALGLHNVMLIVFDFNAAGVRFPFCEGAPASRRRIALGRPTAPDPPAVAASCTPGGDLRGEGRRVPRA